MLRIEIHRQYINNVLPKTKVVRTRSEIQPNKKIVVLNSHQRLILFQHRYSFTKELISNDVRRAGEGSTKNHFMLS